MKRILPLMVSAVLCGVLIMYLPLYVWHQANFPNEPHKAQWALLEPTPIMPFYISLAVSFVISLIAYAFLKRRF